MLVTDLDGDGSDEWIITIFTGPGKEAVCSEYTCSEIGEIWIINDKGVVYRLFNEDEDWLGPIIIAEADFTGDGLSDIVTQSTFMGAHTLTMTYHVLSAHNGKINNVVLLGNELDQISTPFRPFSNYVNEDWSTPGIQLTNAIHTIKENNDGLAELAIDGGYFGSVGAGNHRGREEVWAWDGKAVTLADVTYPETKLRIHSLFDGDYAFILEDYETAAIAYKRAISDDTLTDDILFAPPEEAYPVTVQYAAFRLVLLYLIQDDVEGMSVWREWLNEEYPDSPITQSAEVLINSWQNSGDLTEGCSAVADFQKSHEGFTIWPLNNIGYGNPDISEEKLCPIR
jgi:hypothetical protein